MNKIRAVLFLMLFSMVILYRIYFGVISINTAGLYHIGYIPWSDAKAWFDGAETIIHNGKLTGLPSRRPLFPLYLAVLLIFCGGGYKGTAIAQVAVFLIVLTLSRYIIKNIRNRLSVIAFFSFIVVWRIDSQSLFMTENLGICLLLLSFCLIWSGIFASNISRVLTGFFFLGLSQAVRPWAVFILMTTPFLFFFYKSPWKRNAQMFLLSLIMAWFGMGFHSIAGKLYNDDGAASNFALTFYGQAIGGEGWKSAYNDPVYLKYKNQNLTEKELNQILYKRSLEIVFENPFNILKATIKTYKNYFGYLVPNAFSVGYWHLCFLVCFIGFAYNTLRKDICAHIKRKWPLPLFFIFLAIYDYKWCWMGIFLLGIPQIYFSANKHIRIFVILWFLGILISLPLVGKDGGGRVCIASDILMYFIASMGFSFILTGSRKENTPVFGQLAFTKKSAVLKTITIPLVMLGVLICSPIFVKGYNPTNLPNSIIRNMDGMGISRSLNMDVVPMAIGSLGSWLSPSYGSNQGQWVYKTFRFDYRNTIFLGKEEGILDYNFYFWPMVPNVPPKDRTFLVYPWVVFLCTEPSQLEKFDKRDIIVVGNFYPRPTKNQYYDTQTKWIIVAKKIGYLNENSEIIWDTIPPSK